VLVEAVCTRANFKLADLRDADLSGADFTNATFDRARVHGAVLAGATFGEPSPDLVDISATGDGSELVPVGAWAAGAGGGTAEDQRS